MATAAEVAALHGLSVTSEARLREIDCGAWTGKNRAELDAEFPGDREAWASTPNTMRMPGGETLHEAQARALAFFADRMPLHQGETIVVISPGGVGQTVLVNAMGGTVDDLWLKERVDNCQISRLHWTPDKGLELIELADVRHLEDVGSLRGWRTTDSA